MTSAGVLMLMLSKPLIRLTPLYSGILSKWTMCLKFQLTMQRRCPALARATWRASVAHFGVTTPALQVAVAQADGGRRR